MICEASVLLTAAVHGIIPTVGSHTCHDLLANTSKTDRSGIEESWRKPEMLWGPGMGLAHLCMVLSLDLSGAASLYGDLFTLKWNTMLATQLWYTTVHIIAQYCA